MPTLKEDQKIPHRKSLVNENYRKKRGYISDNTLLIIGKHGLDPKTTSINYTEFFIGVFSDFYADRMIAEYLEEKGIITSEKCTHLKEISFNSMRSLVLEVLDPERTYPTPEDWDRADEFFIKVICPRAAYNADTIFQINKPRIDRSIKTCRLCGKSFIAKKQNALYCHSCKKTANAVNVQKYRENHKATPAPKKCGYCHNTFAPKRDNAVFCCDKCRVYFSREKGVISLS